MVEKERDPKLARAVKEINRTRNGGVIVCEGCNFSDESGALFDAHHRDPLGKGRAGVARRVLRCSVQRVIVGVIIRLLTFFSLLPFPR